MMFSQSPQRFHFVCSVHTLLGQPAQYVELLTERHYLCNTGHNKMNDDIKSRQAETRAWLAYGGNTKQNWNIHAVRESSLCGKLCFSHFGKLAENSCACKRQMDVKCGLRLTIVTNISITVNSDQPDENELKEFTFAGIVTVHWGSITCYSHLQQVSQQPVTKIRYSVIHGHVKANNLYTPLLLADTRQL